MTHFTSERVTTEIVMISQAETEEFATRLIGLSIPFAVESLPNDHWTFTIPREHAALVRRGSDDTSAFVAALVGRSFHDTSHPEEPDFIVAKWDPEEPEVIDLDNGQWYVLDGPEGFLAKRASGVITETKREPERDDLSLRPRPGETAQDVLARVQNALDHGA